MAPHPAVFPVFSQTISSHDRGFLYGDGLFETVRCCDGQLLLWQQHRQRLIAGCGRLAIAFDPAELDCQIKEAIKTAPSADCILKVIVTRGEGGRGYTPPTTGQSTLLMQWHPLPADISHYARDGIDAFVCCHPLSVNPVTAGLKHLNRLDQVLASDELSRVSAVMPTVREGLMLDIDGNLIEGTRSNVFVVINNQLCTPDLGRAGVQGVLRNRLIELFDSQGFNVVIRQIHQQEIGHCSEIFVCNSVLGVWPVMRLISLDSLNMTHTHQSLPSTKMARLAQQSLLAEFPVHNG